MAPTQLKTVSCDKCRSLKVKCVKVEAQSACSNHLRDLATRLDGVLDRLAKPDEDKTASTSTYSFSTGAGANLPGPTPEIVLQNASTTVCSSNDWQTRLGLDRWLLAHLLQRYRTMQHYFPFVVVLESWNVPYMLEFRPTLFLAVAASAACHYPVVQQALNRELKETLAHRVLVGGETSLELLQTVLVYLAWFHYYLVPRSQLIHRYLQIAVGMTVDLKVVLNGCPSDSHEGRLPSASNDFSGSFSEARRASLGCEYLSSSISSFLLKPNTMSFNGSVSRYSEALTQLPELESDFTIKPLVQYQQMLEEVLAIYREERKTSSRLHLQTKQMDLTLDHWWRSLPQHVRSMCFFKTRYHHLRILVLEMGLLYHFQVDGEATVSVTRCPAIGNNLVACVDAIKDYLDTLLAMEGSEWNYLPCEEWSRLIIAFSILYKISVGPREISGWNVELCRGRVDFAKYLDAVADHICNSRESLETSSEETIESIYFVLPDILRSARASFVVARDTPHLTKPGDRVHVSLSKEHIRGEVDRSNIQRRCPVTSMWADRALLLDQETDWRTVELSRALDPAEQLAKNEKLWSDLLGMQLGTEDG